MSRCKLLTLSLVALVPFLWPGAAAFAGHGGGGGHGGHGGGHGGGHAGGGHYGGVHHGGGHYGGGHYGGYRGGYGYGGYGLGGYGLGYGLGGYGLGGYGLGYGGYGLGGYGYGLGGYGGYSSGYGISGYPQYVAPSYGQGYVVPTYVDPSVQPLDTRQSGYYAPSDPDNTARIRVFVPADAKVWIGGEETTKTGDDRVFASPTLTPGKSYTYQVKAVWTQDGKQVERTQNVKVRANETSNVTFGQ